MEDREGRRTRLDRVREAGTELREALLDVVSHRDWEPEYASLADYLRAELGYSRSHAYRLQTWMTELTDQSPTGDHSDRPANERQARKAREKISKDAQVVEFSEDDVDEDAEDDEPENEEEGPYYVGPFISYRVPDSEFENSKLLINQLLEVLRTFAKEHPDMDAKWMHEAVLALVLHIRKQSDLATVDKVIQKVLLNKKDE